MTDIQVVIEPPAPIEVLVEPPAPIDVSWGPIGLPGPPGPPGQDGFVVIEPGGTVPPGTPPGTVIIERSA